jgi:chloramphenicol 3-O phosphotransferase
MSGPGDQRAAAQHPGQLRASHADREQTIEQLKAAFVDGSLTKDEFDLRVGQTLASQTHADLTSVTSDLQAAMAQAGARIIVDEVFIGGAASQQRWKDALGPLQVLWVGVRCEAAVATARELARGDRIAGMAASQAEIVHRGIAYDLQVDTTHTEALECAQAIAARLR